MLTLALARAHRADLQTLTGLAEGDLSLIWDQFNMADAVSVRDGLIEVLPRLSSVYGSAAATLGADYYDEARAAADVKGRFSGISAELPDRGSTDVLARWSVGPLFSSTPDSASALTLVTGGLQRIIANADRKSVMGSSIADKRARGWQRTGFGECAFCAMLIGRGAVYSKASADFASHDHCLCQCVPIFKGAEPISVKDYVPTARNITDADRARVRAYIAAHPQ